MDFLFELQRFANDIVLEGGKFTLPDLHDESGKVGRSLIIKKDNSNVVCGNWIWNPGTSEYSLVINNDLSELYDGTYNFDLTCIGRYSVHVESFRDSEILPSCSVFQLFAGSSFSINSDYKNSTAFTISADKSVTAPGAITVGNGTVTLKNAVDVILNEGTSVTFQADLNTTSPKVTAQEGGEITLTASGDAPGNITVSAAGKVTGLANGDSASANGVTVTNTADAELTVQAKNGEAIVETDAYGSCSAVIGAGKKANIDGTTYTNASETATATITKANGGTAVLTAGEVVIPSGGSVAVGNTTYTAAEGGATINATNGFVGGAVTLDINETITVGGTTYTAAVNGTVIDYNNGSAKLTAGTVELGNNEAILVGETSYTAGNNGAKIDYNNGNAKMAAGSVSFESGKNLKVGDTTYTAGTNGATINLNGAIVELRGGAVILDENESIEVNGRGVLTNNGSIAISVTSDGKILATDGSALPAKASFTTSDGTYTVKYTLSMDAKEIKVTQAGRAKGRKPSSTRHRERLP